MKLFSGIKNRYYAKKYEKEFKKAQKQQQKAAEKIEEINDSILPITFKPTKDGRYLETNDTFIQCLVVGRLTPRYKDRQDYPSNLDPRLTEEILNIGTKKETSIELTHCLRMKRTRP